MDDILKSSRCKINCLKSNFHRNTKMSDGFNPHCKICRNNFVNENLVKIKKNHSNNRDKKKEYYLKKCDKISIRHNEYVKNRLKTDVNFRLIHNTRQRIPHALNNNLKSSSNRDILGKDIDLYRKWIEWQMTPEMNWSNTEIDHVKPICMFDVSKDEVLRETFNWKNTQPLLKKFMNKRGLNLIC